MMKTRALYTGKWAGLTAKTVSKLFNISYYMTKKILEFKKIELNRDLTLEDLGELIFEARSNKEDMWMNL